MSDQLKDILSNLNTDIDQETLLKYINHQLSKEEVHHIEEKLTSTGFESDAVDGLHEIDKERLAFVVESLNRDLKKRTAKKIARRKKRELKPQWWLYFSIILFLIILVLVYMYLHQQMRG